MHVQLALLDCMYKQCAHDDQSGGSCGACLLSSTCCCALQVRQAREESAARVHGLEETVRRLAQKHELGLQVRVSLHATLLL